MKYTFTFIFLISITNTINAQSLTNKVEILNEKEVSALVTDSLRTKYNLSYPVYRVYKYTDKSGTYFTILTESLDSIGSNSDTLSKRIKAVNLRKEKIDFSKVWELNDFVNVPEKDEISIWFWTKYFDFTDFDNDAVIEPVIVYGTFGQNGYDDGRIRIIIYYKGKKIAIRHQNGTLDFSERRLEIDQSFYSLPSKMQTTIKEKMKSMMKNNHAIFPAGWEKGMNKKKTTIQELNN